MSIGISTFLLLVIFLILNHYGLFFNYNSKANLIVPIISSQFILGILYIFCLSFVYEFSSKLFRLYFSNSLSSELFLEKNEKNDNEVNSINQYYPNKKTIISNSPLEKINEEKSNSSFISKKSSFNNNKLSLINNNNKKYLDVPKSFKFKDFSKNNK